MSFWASSIGAIGPPVRRMTGGCVGWEDSVPRDGEARGGIVGGGYWDAPACPAAEVFEGCHRDAKRIQGEPEQRGGKLAVASDCQPGRSKRR